MIQTEDVIIIGAGPAGLSAALQLKRYGITPLLLEAGEMGGLLRNANQVENYPGFPRGITGSDLVELFKEQAKNASITVTKGKVVNITHDGMLFQVSTEAEHYASRIVVVASGTKPKTFSDLQVPSALEEKVHYEVYSLLHLVGRHLTIVGAGDAAFDYALNLGENNQITILNRGEKIKCLPLLWERAALSPNITYLEKTRLVEISESPDDGIKLNCVSPEGALQLSTDYLIGAIGREAQLDFMPDNCQESYQILENQGMLYQIGDVCNGIYRQTSIAVGQGVLTAMKIYRCLKETTI
jgi:thioredoxin reductase (NADPH)